MPRTFTLIALAVTLASSLPAQAYLSGFPNVPDISPSETTSGPSDTVTRDKTNN